MIDISEDLIEGHFERTVAAGRPSWSMTSGEARKLDLVNHVLRVILQVGLLEGYVDEFAALASCQHPDGGWGDVSSEGYSGVRNTCFAARNLIRASREVDGDDLRPGIERAVRLVMERQNADGSWPDRRWGTRDATSSSMGLLLYSVQEDWGERTADLHAAAAAALRRGAEYLCSTQEPDGSWADDSAYEAPVGPTAHLLPKMVLYRGEARPEIRSAIAFLVGQQDVDGSWDRQHVDHTCDATRALLLTHSILPAADLRPTVTAGVQWLAAHPNDDGGWGVRPGKPSSLIMTCDVLDCFSKYQAYQRAQDLRAFWQ